MPRPTRASARPSARPSALAAASLAALGLASCAEPAPTGAPAAAGPTLARAGYDQPGVHRQYGAPIAVGQGRARAYVVLDQKRGGAPLEIGVALDERALDGLPMGGGGHHDGGHAMAHEYLLPLPAQNPTPFRLVEVNWNPAGHDPAGIYDTPHFDFHFYTITRAERDAIDPADPAYATKANRVPTGAFVPPFNVVLGPPGAPPAAMAVPKMGVHWSDLRSPELQRMLGNPGAHRPFTTTFIHGSWDGRFIFQEPMVTRSFLLGRKAATAPAARDSVMAIAVAGQYRPAGYYPAAYRVAYDAQAKEYRIALTGLAARP
jgi:hypothetical protein